MTPDPDAEKIAKALTPAQRKAPYVIINDTDQPCPNMVCQWIEGVGYCYLDRRGTKPDHDGMRGLEATPVEAFGFVWTNNRDRTVSFYRATIPVTATYSDGEPRQWQHRADSFEFQRLTRARVRAVLALEAT